MFSRLVSSADGDVRVAVAIQDLLAFHAGPIGICVQPVAGFPVGHVISRVALQGHDMEADAGDLMGLVHGDGDIADMLLSHEGLLRLDQVLERIGLR